jgi:maltose/moltooligosaccharide transporter
MKFRYGPIWILGFGQLAIILLGATYDFCVPIFLQAGRPGYDAGAEVRGFGLNPAITGLVMTLDNMAALLILPYMGALSDRTRTRWGRRKPFIMVGVPIAVAAFVLIPATLGAPLPLFMCAIIVWLLAMDLFRTPLTALMPDLTPPAQRSPANGIITFMGTLGAILGIGLGGGYLFGLSPAAPFLFGAVMTLAAMGVLLAAVREPAQPEAAEKTPGMLASLSTVLRDRNRSALLLLGSIFCAWLGFSAIRIFFPSFAIGELRVERDLAGRLMAVFPIAMLVGAVPAGFLGARLGRRRVILMGVLLFGGLMAWPYTIQTIPPLLLALALNGLAFSLILVNALPLVLDYAPPFRDGAYAGLFFIATQSAEIAGPVLAGQALHLTGEPRALFIYIPCTLILAFILMLGVRRSDKPVLTPLVDNDAG